MSGLCSKCSVRIEECQVVGISRFHANIMPTTPTAYNSCVPLCRGQLDTHLLTIPSTLRYKVPSIRIVCKKSPKTPISNILDFDDVLRSHHGLCSTLPKKIGVLRGLYGAVGIREDSYNTSSLDYFCPLSRVIGPLLARALLRARSFLDRQIRSGGASNDSLTLVWPASIF